MMAVILQDLNKVVWKVTGEFQCLTIVLVFFLAADLSLPLGARKQNKTKQHGKFLFEYF